MENLRALPANSVPGGINITEPAETFDQSVTLGAKLARFVASENTLHQDVAILNIKFPWSAVSPAALI